MKKIINPWDHTPGFKCFGCSKDNPLGLKLDFFEDEEFIMANFEPYKNLQGYQNVLHGGIQATLLDEISSWAIYIKLQTSGVTASMNIKYRNPVYISEGSVLLKAKILEHKGRIANIKAELFDREKKLCSEADVQYFVFPKDIAISKYNYPGIEKFYSTNDF